MPGSIRIFVRTRQKYAPEHYKAMLWHMDVTDFALCTIGNIKRKCKSEIAAKFDDLFYQHERLSDERSVAHYNFPDGSILETTSNPLWVAMNSVKIWEVQREQDLHPEDRKVQIWTTKSIIKRKTLFSILYNTKNTGKTTQPDNFPTYDELIDFLVSLNRKGAVPHHEYTGRDFQRWFAEHVELDLHEPDPIRAFLARHAARLGIVAKDGGLQPAKSQKKGTAPNRRQPTKRPAAATATRPRQPFQERLCENCEENMAAIYCGSCAGPEGKQGVVLCDQCTDQIHQGALNSKHDCQDISEAPRPPRNPQGYVPQPYRAPFAILLAMTRALKEDRHKLSMDEEEMKARAQPLTDTDLTDKQAGKIMGGFDCVENTLIPKSLIQKEAADRHTYALTRAGQDLGNKLDIFDKVVQRFLLESGVPQLPAALSSMVGRRQLVLVVDQHERDIARLEALAANTGISILVRPLPVADYIWVLSPEGYHGAVPYDGSRPQEEIMLPVLVERKSWNDLHDSMREGRWNTQLRKMKACGLVLNFLLVEGCISDLRHVDDDRKERLQTELESQMLGEGFYVAFTACWSKSSLWLFWLTHLLATAYAKGQFAGETLQFSELQARLTRGMREQRSGHVVRPVNPPGPCFTWDPDKLVTAIYRESLGDKKMGDTCQQFFSAKAVRQLLVLQEFERFNKNRHTMLQNCLKQATAIEHCTLEAVTGIVEGELANHVKGLVHYDVVGFWSLFIQVNHRVYVVRTENDQETHRLAEQFSASAFQQAPAAPRAPIITPPQTKRARVAEHPHFKATRNERASTAAMAEIPHVNFPTKRRASATATITRMEDPVSDYTTVQLPLVDTAEMRASSATRLAKNPVVARVAPQPVPANTSVTAPLARVAHETVHATPTHIEAEDGSDGDHTNGTMLADDDFALDSQNEEKMLQEALSLSLIAALDAEGPDVERDAINQYPLEGDRPARHSSSGRGAGSPQTLPQSFSRYLPSPNHTFLLSPSNSPRQPSSPLGFSNDDPIMIDSQGLDDGHLHMHLTFDHDAALARKLQEEEEKRVLPNGQGDGEAQHGGKHEQVWKNEPCLSTEDEALARKLQEEEERNALVSEKGDSKTEISRPVRDDVLARKLQELERVAQTLQEEEKWLSLLSEKQGDSKTDLYVPTDDEMLARKLQEEEQDRHSSPNETLDVDRTKEAPMRQLSDSYNAGVRMDDEKLARRLQFEEDQARLKMPKSEIGAVLDFEPPFPCSVDDSLLDMEDVRERSFSEINSSYTGSSHADASFTDQDAELARKLQEEEELAANRLHTPKRPRSDDGGARSSKDTAPRISYVRDADLKRDEELARKLQEEEERARSSHLVNVELLEVEESTPNTGSQLEEYRMLQGERFKHLKTPPVRKPLNDRHMPPFSGLSGKDNKKGLPGVENVMAPISASKRQASATVTSKDLTSVLDGAVDSTPDYKVTQPFLDKFNAKEIGKQPAAFPVQRFPSFDGKLGPSPAHRVKASHNDSVDLSRDDDDKPVLKKAAMNDDMSLLKFTKQNDFSSQSSVCASSQSALCGKKDDSVLFPLHTVQGAALDNVKTDNISLIEDDDDDIAPKAVPVTGMMNNCGGGNAAVQSCDEENQPGIGLAQATIVSNVKCGSCGQKGHNRRCEGCPNYYTQTEQLHRDKIEADKRRRAEERARDAEERQIEELRTLERLNATREVLEEGREAFMQQMAAATQRYGTRFGNHIDDINRLIRNSKRKIDGHEAKQQRKK